MQSNFIFIPLKTESKVVFSSKGSWMQLVQSFSELFESFRVQLRIHSTVTALGV